MTSQFRSNLVKIPIEIFPKIEINSENATKLMIAQLLKINAYSSSSSDKVNVGLAKRTES